MGGVHQFIPVLNMLVAPKILNQQTDRRALRVPKHQAGADLILDRDQVEFLPDLSVVTSLNLFQLRKMRVEFRLGRKGSPIDPLQHGIAFVSAPVRTGSAQEFECPNMTCRWKMGAAAQVGELTLTID